MSPIIVVALLVLTYVLLGAPSAPDRPRARSLADRARPGRSE